MGGHGARLLHCQPARPPTRIACDCRPPPASLQARCYEQGLCRTVGVSNFGPRQLRAIAVFMASRGVPLVANQVQYSLLSRMPERTGLVEACGEAGVQLIAYSPLCLGLLTGKYSAERLPEGPRALLFRQLLREAAPVLAVQRAVRGREWGCRRRGGRMR